MGKAPGAARWVLYAPGSLRTSESHCQFTAGVNSSCIKVSPEDSSERPYLSTLLGKWALDVKIFAYQAPLVGLSILIDYLGFI